MLGHTRTYTRIFFCKGAIKILRLETIETKCQNYRLETKSAKYDKKRKEEQRKNKEKKKNQKYNRYIIIYKCYRICYAYHTHNKIMEIVIQFVTY